MSRGYRRLGAANGCDWTTVWANPVEITDNSWTAVSYDISAVADDQETVFLRWTMGTTDVGWRFCGWYIDDIEIWGVAAAVMGTGDDELPTVAAIAGVHPNPINPRTTITFALPRDGQVRLGVYDLSGRRVAVLIDGTQPADRREVSWDGRAATGKPLASGVYCVRLEIGAEVSTAKLALVR